MTKTMVAVRGVDEDTFRKFRALTVEERIKMGDALTLAMRRWVAEERKREATIKAKNLLNLKPVRVGKKKVRWSEEIDEFLYGESL
ncbi:MAG: hypothetical protein HYW25_02990 [Candidatus Aenigmarchaeota archaeon]|nr:hypothetical protein [Candidatus Aenigmarchaeota archaeon]